MRPNFGNFFIGLRHVLRSIDEAVQAGFTPLKVSRLHRSIFDILTEMLDKLRGYERVE